MGNFCTSQFCSPCVFGSLMDTLKSNNIQEVKKILHDHNVTLIGDNEKNFLMYCCLYAKSREAMVLCVDKVLKAGGPALLKSQLTEKSRNGSTCLVLSSYGSSSVEVTKLVFEKVFEVGGPDLLKSQLLYKNEFGLNCLGYTSMAVSREVTTFLVTVLFCFGLFREHYANLDDKTKEKLNVRLGIASASWTPGAESIAEVQKTFKLTDAVDKGAAKKKVEEQAALVNRKAEEEKPALKKIGTDENQPQGPLPQEDPASFDSPPPARCFKRGVPDENLEGAVDALFSIKEAPANRPDLAKYIPDSDDASDLLHYLKTALPALKERPAIKKLIAECGLTDDEIKILHSYKIQNPYPVYLWLNGWLGGDRRDDFVKENVAPFFVLLYRAMQKLPKVTTPASRAIQVKGIASLKVAYNNYKAVCAPGKTLSFWGFSSFSTESDVVNREEFVGKPQEEAIVYSCGQLEGVDMEPFAPKGLKDESEILPLCPCVLEVVNHVKMGQKLIVGVKQLDHAGFAYVAPKQ